LGRTDLEVVRIGCGGIPIIKEEFDDAVAVVKAALEAGVNYFDNARAYGDSETKMGVALEGRRDDIILATKVHFRDREKADEALRTSLKELRTDHIDVYQLHDVSTAVDFDKVMAPGGVLDMAKEARKADIVRFIGASSHNETCLRRLIESGEFDTVLLTYNIASRWPENEILPLAKQHDVGVVVMKPMSGGIFFHLSRQADDSAPSITPEEAMRFVLSNEHIDVALSGFRQVQEVPQNMAVLRDFAPLTAEERERLTAFGDSLGQVYCRHCTYCLPCSQDIDIPTILALLDHSERFSYEWPTHRRKYAKLEVKADVCVECGDCEGRCPFGVPIQERLKIAVKKFGDKPY
jgi:hypothetical protein